MNIKRWLNEQDAARGEYILFIIFFFTIGMQVGYRQAEMPCAEWAREHTFCPSGSEKVLCEGDLTVDGVPYENYVEYLRETEDWLT